MLLIKISLKEKAICDTNLWHSISEKQFVTQVSIFTTLIVAAWTSNFSSKQDPGVSPGVDAAFSKRSVKNLTRLAFANADNEEKLETDRGWYEEVCQIKIFLIC